MNPDALAALRPTPDRGRAVLVSGGTAQARRDAMDAAVTRLIEGPAGGRPLVVRLAPHTPGAKLSEALPEAVEATLERLRAPGMLYEDRGCEAVRSLGSWLFRARTLRIEGLCLVLDDLDRWLDGRGRKDDPASWFLPLLAECGHRSLSLLASCRAGTAAGAPSLPSSLAVLFDDTVSLGGPPTVTRDPTTLVAALAGRTFSLPSLQEALAGWLELPAPPDGSNRDDVLVVFRSPLAAPMFETPTESPAEVEWSASSKALPSLRPPAEAPKLSGELKAEDLAKAPSLIAAQVSLGLGLRRAGELPLSTAAQVKEALEEHFVTLPSSIDRVTEGARRLGATTPQVVDLARSSLARFELQFASHREAVLASYPGLDGLSDYLHRVAERFGARTSAKVFLTGWRADLMDDLHAALGVLGGFTVQSEGLSRVEDELAASAAAAWREDTADGGRRPRRVQVRSHEAERVMAYAHALTAPNVSLAEGALAARPALLEGLRAVGGGFAGVTAVLFVADAGTGEVIDADGQRGLGDGTAFASVVPWTVATFGA